MNAFEKIDPIELTERDDPREKHPSIELTDEEHLNKMHPRLSKEMELIYKPPSEESMSPALNVSCFKRVVPVSTKDYKRHQNSRLKEKDEKNKSKTSKKSDKKVPAKPNKPTVARLQKKL